MALFAGQHAQIFEDRHCLRSKVYEMRPAALCARGRNAPKSSLKVEFAPGRVGHLALTLSGQDQDGERGNGYRVSLTADGVAKCAPYFGELIQP